MGQDLPLAPEGGSPLCGSQDQSYQATWELSYGSWLESAALDLGHRHSEMEGAALSQLALDPDTSALGLDQTLRD
jgi:hypothetical protein